jgi:hypothetical protein
MSHTPGVEKRRQRYFLNGGYRITFWPIALGEIFAWFFFVGFLPIDLSLRGHPMLALESIFAGVVITVVLFSILVWKPDARTFDVASEGLLLRFHSWRRPSSFTVPWPDVVRCWKLRKGSSYGLGYETRIGSFEGGILVFNEGTCRAILPYLPPGCKRDESVKALEASSRHVVE